MLLEEDDGFAGCAGVELGRRRVSWIPGLQTARNYRREWLTSDLIAGVSVAAVALPVAIAYAKLAGFPPVVGIYSSILPLVAYALFGSSRQLIVNPDAAVCAMVAATLAPLSAGHAARHTELSIALCFLAGVLCILGGVLGFGAIANFLSRPILTGYLNGIALSIISKQLETMLGFDVPSAGFFLTLVRVGSHLNQTHLVTFVLGVVLFVLLRLLRRLGPQVPAALVVSVLAIVAVDWLGLARYGVAVIGEVPAGFPAPRIPAVSSADLWQLAAGASGIVLVSFCSMMTTARGFAAKNHYEIDANQDMIALGFCDLASGLGGGFVVSGADSRTAVADSTGGKSQLTGLVAAAAITAVLLFLTRPLANLPTVALGAILISSAIGLFDFGSLRDYYRVSPPEFRHSLVAMLGVMTVGVLPGILIAVALALLRLLRQASHPHDAILSLVEGADGVYTAEGNAGKPVPGLMMFRFDASLLFFNADYFKERVLDLVSATEPKPSWFLLDAGSIPALDISGAAALESLHADLAGRGIAMAVARARGMFQVMFVRSGVSAKIGEQWLFPTVHAAVDEFRRTQKVAA